MKEHLSVLHRRDPLRLPLKILQFGEGNFLRAFVDWMVHRLNERGLFLGSIRLVQPLARGKASEINAQDGLYTTLLRGRVRGETVRRADLITCVSGCLDPYTQWTAVVDDICRDSLRFIVSNTTEAGIHYQEEPFRRGDCLESYPAKLTSLLYERFLHFRGAADHGLILLPCELIEHNGKTLKSCVLRHAKAWNLEPEFAEWLESENRFADTLVDRIVPGFPEEEFESLSAELGYQDRLLVCAEPFHFWAIEGVPDLESELPLRQGGFDVVLSDDLKPYRDRKVRLLNGAHTATALAAHLAGLEFVHQTVEDPLFASYLNKLLFKEIAPTVPLPEQEKTGFAESVLERFANPFIKHRLLSIALNSISKWRVRVLPTLEDSRKSTGSFPPLLLFSLAALIVFYRNRAGFQPSGHRIADDPGIVGAMEAFWNEYETSGDVERLARSVLEQSDFWGRDLTEWDGLTERIGRLLRQIESSGIRQTMQHLLDTTS